jgi:hypothetical protein
VDTKADQIVLNSVQQGWYTNTGTTNAFSFTPNNYFVGAAGGQGYRNYFVFSLTYVTAITNAQLRIERSSDINLDTDAFETYVLYDVQTDAGVLGHVDGVPIYDDLGSGTVFASVNVPTPRVLQPEILTINLNADALAAIQSNGGWFAIGGAVTTLRSPFVPISYEGLFAFSGPSVQLIVEGQQVPVPEPATMALLASGLAAVAIRLRRRSSHR